MENLNKPNLKKHASDQKTVEIIEYKKMNL